jgi:hypothetical protein
MLVRTSTANKNKTADLRTQTSLKVGLESGELSGNEGL